MNAPILSSLKIKLPTDAGRLETFVLSEPRAYPDKAKGAFNRVAFSAAHVVADARAANDPWLDCALDWEQTLRYREYLWDLGLGVAEAMDTAQRGMGLDWPTSLELITRAVKAGKAWEAQNGRPALIASGCGTDHLDPAERALRRRGDPRLRGADGGDRESRWAADRHGQPRAGPRRQIAGRLRARLCPRALARPRSPSSSTGWARCSIPRSPATGARPTTWPAMDTAVGIINAHAAKVDGVKISLLDKDKEIAMRRRSPRACACIPATTSTTPS